MGTLTNEKEYPSVYYARHIKEGLVHYLEHGKDNLYLVTNDALKKMNGSFEGKPIYVNHVDKVDLDNIRNSSDGYVIESFYNEFDGAWWCKMLIISDDAKNAVRKGWAVSNAYLPTELGSGGTYHDINYQKEVRNGDYQHLAIVSNPRYEEAVIMTPSEFKSYNERHKAELEQLKNSKENEMLSDEEMNSLVESIKNSLVETIKDTVKNAVEEKMAEDKKNSIDEDHRAVIKEIAEVALKNESDLAIDAKINALSELMSKLNEKEEVENKCNEDEEEEDKEEEDVENSSDTEEEKENSDDEEKDSEEEEKENKCNETEEEKKEEEKTNSKGFFSALKNAKINQEVKFANTMQAGIALGKKRYGSK